MVFHVRRLPECSERQGNLDLREGSMELCSSGEFFGVRPNPTMSHIG